MNIAGGAGAVFGLLLALAGAPAHALDQRDIALVSTLDTLVPLAPADLEGQRGGRLPAVLPSRRDTSPPVRLWDEIVRPPRPVTGASQGVVSSVSRAAR